MADHDLALREQLYQLLLGANAHADLASALADFPAHLYGAKPEGCPHSGWELLEHIRIALRDLWEFSTSAEYVEKKWPDDYWPAASTPPSPDAWQASLHAVAGDLELFGKLIRNPKANLFAPVPTGKKDQTLLREVLLVADHNSYHTGELVLLRRTLDAWKS